MNTSISFRAFLDGMHFVHHVDGTKHKADRISSKDVLEYGIDLEEYGKFVDKVNVDDPGDLKAEELAAVFELMFGRQMYYHGLYQYKYKFVEGRPNETLRVDRFEAGRTWLFFSVTPKADRASRLMDISQYLPKK